MTLYYLPQKVTTFLSTVGGIDASQTTGIKVTSVSGVDITKAGILCLNWSNPIDTSLYEYITYTSIDGTNELVGVTRGAEGSTGRIHSNGVVVAWVYSKSHINELNKVLEGTTTGATLTSPVINTGFSGTAVATGANITTGTSETLIVTPKALADATVGKLGSSWTSFTPTISNLTLGSGGSKTGFYMQIGKAVFFRIRVVLGTAPSVGAMGLTLPISSVAYPELAKIGDIIVLDAGTAYIACSLFSDGGMYAPVASATYINHNTFSSAIPMTWAVNDGFSITGCYEAA